MSTSDGAPQRPSPINAARRAFSVEIFRRRDSALQQRPLRDAAGRGIDEHADLVDAGWGRMRFEIEQDERAQDARVVKRGRQLELPDVHLARDETQPHVQRRGAAIVQPELRAQRLEQPGQEKGQRLEPFDRPFERQHRLEPLRLFRRHQRPRIFAARQPLQEQPLAAKPLEQRSRWQRDEIAERFEAPSVECVKNRGTGDREPGTG